MPVLTAAEVAGYWVGAGGPKNRAVEWVAIAIGESSLNTDALSPVGAIGLWQIMPFNAPPYGYTAAQLYDPHVNASVAVQMSGGGTNCAAWDSCYTDIYSSGRLTFLAWPQQGSADFNNLSVAAAEMGGSTIDPLGSSAYPGLDSSLTNVVSVMQRISGAQLPAVAAKVTGTGRSVSRMYRR